MTRQNRKWTAAIACAACRSSSASPNSIFGAITEEAVKQFQRRHGLPVTGDPDEKTWDTLERQAAGAFGVSPPGAKPAETGVQPVSPGAAPVTPGERPLQPNLGLGAGTMNPLIAIAASVLPDIIKTIAGDRAGTVSGAVTNAVTEITRTQNPQEASNKLAADPRQERRCSSNSRKSPPTRKRSDSRRSSPC